jgi:hypothetical protein
MSQMPGMPQVSYTPPTAPQVSYTPPGAPQMAYTPPAAPQFTPPQVVGHPAAKPPAMNSNMLLIAIICLAAFLVGGIVVYWLVRPK